uniref:Uncharacterized protein n=1 Tax=Plectus sambesii TaxID=2011161 RepID=A0A914W4A4_9BILA
MADTEQPQLPTTAAADEKTAERAVGCVHSKQWVCGHCRPVVVAAALNERLIHAASGKQRPATQAVTTSTQWCAGRKWPYTLVCCLRRLDPVRRSVEV